MSDELSRAVRNSFFGAEVRAGATEELHPDARACGLFGAQKMLEYRRRIWDESRFYFAWDKGEVGVEVWDARVLSSRARRGTIRDSTLRVEEQGIIVRFQPASSGLVLSAVPLDMTLLARADSKSSSVVRTPLLVLLACVSVFAAVPLLAGAPLGASAAWAAAVFGLVGVLFLLARLGTRGVRQEQDAEVARFAVSGLPKDLLEQYELKGDPKQPGVAAFVSALHTMRARFPDRDIAANHEGKMVFLYLRGLDIAGPLATMRHKMGLTSGEMACIQRVAELKRIIDDFLATGLFQR